MQQLLVVLVLLVDSASVFPEVLVPLDVQLDQVADFDRVDFSGATVADLKEQTVKTVRPASRRTSPDLHSELRLQGGSSLSHLVHGLAQDVLVLVLGDVFALVVGLDGQLDLLHRPLLRVELLQVLPGDNKVHLLVTTTPSASSPTSAVWNLSNGTEMI